MWTLPARNSQGGYTCMPLTVIPFFVTLVRRWQTQGLGPNPALHLVLSAGCLVSPRWQCWAPCPELRSSYIYTVLKLHSAFWRQPWGWCGPRWKWVWHPCSNGQSIYLNLSLKLYTCCPGCCGSVDWAQACKPKGRWFDSQSGHVPGLWARSSERGTWKATTYDVSLPLFFPPSSSLKVK